ncbi:DUF805 domain-containing protein [Echinicola jeungdonensis]|uniref:DUF805 domain-containing protein n=1 Tax=Echinicola jeungdonensis TaxID=709343 RepID=A0ABV5J7G0_9BACT|nr:DUF805 domain-containing protein [Echinicola jeungdonensis]MDN3669069.1 DUF805 domain-containing protein [Echinicola jeungdonensis]
MYYYLKGLHQYADFKGRARRKEYWMFTLFNILISIAAVLLDNLIGWTIGAFTYGPIFLTYLLAIFLPSLGVTVRRLHDIGKSAWLVLIAFIPFIGAIWLLILMVADGDPYPNKYGNNPKMATAEA